MVKKNAKSRASQRKFQARGRDGSEWEFCQKLPPGRVGLDWDFAEQLRDAITRCGASQYHIAEAAGVPQASISFFMSGKDLKLSTFTRLARVMGMSLEQDASLAPKKIL